MWYGVKYDVAFKGGFVKLVKRLLSTPKVSGSNPIEAQKF